jgi:L-amino acid N-acyltransferase YncA
MTSVEPALSPLLIDPMTREDWPAVCAIYEAGIATGHATFESSAPSREDWDRAHAAAPRLVARAARGAPILGWAAVSPVSGRCVYAGVAEVSVYVAAAARGRGVGRTLLAALVKGCEAAGLWTLQAGIFPENTASIALHRAAGFRKVGVRERIGKMRTGGMQDRWRDVLLYERRSPTVGSA